MIETPRHVKKPGGLWKRVENPDELAAALADGWVIRLGDPVQTVMYPPPAPVMPDAVAEAGSDVSLHADVEPAVEPVDVPAVPAKPRGRPKKGA